MDIKLLANGLLPTILGTICILLHNELGDLTTKQRGKMMGIEYGDDIRRFNQKCFLIVGLISIFLGFSFLLHLISF